MLDTRTAQRCRLPDQQGKVVSCLHLLEGGRQPGARRDGREAELAKTALPSLKVRQQRLDRLCGQSRAENRQPRARRYGCSSPNLEPVSWGKTPMGIACAFICRASRVARQHRPRFPAREAHQVTLRAAVGQPVMRERVPKLMRVEIG